MNEWTWYALEFDGVDRFFGLVVGQETELGYFSLSEMEAFRGRFGLGIERDLYFDPVPLSQVRGKSLGVPTPGGSLPGRKNDHETDL